MVILWHQAYSDYANEIEDIFASGNKVVARFTIRGTQDGLWHDLPPSGKKIEVTENMIARIENGKIVEFWPEEDVLTRWQQLGYTFMLPQAAREEKQILGLEPKPDVLAANDSGNLEAFGNVILGSGVYSNDLHENMLAFR